MGSSRLVSAPTLCLKIEYPPRKFTCVKTSFIKRIFTEFTHPLFFCSSDDAPALGTYDQQSKSPASRDLCESSSH